MLPSRIALRSVLSAGTKLPASLAGPVGKQTAWQRIGANATLVGASPPLCRYARPSTKATPESLSPILSRSALTSTAWRRHGSTSTLPTSDAEGVPEEAADASEVPPGYSVGHLYFDSVFPLTLGRFDPREYISALQGDAQLTQLRKVLPDQEKIGFGFRVVGVESRAKDGGAFLTFVYRPEAAAMDRAVGPIRRIPSNTILTQAEAATLSVINSRIRPHLRPIHQYSFSPARLLPNTWLPKPKVHIVLGTPWLEDLARYPARALTISFIEGGAPTEQELWEILRPYGRVTKMEINAKENKATVCFNRMRSATSARNCLYGASVAKHKLVIDYIPAMHGQKIWEWLSSHPRIVLPILAFFLGTITYAVFDPVRAFFIRSNVENTFSLSDYRIYAWLKRNTVKLFQSDKDTKDDSLDDWWERKAAVNEIQGWLRETPSTFITIAGPRGSGKHPLLQRATSNKAVKHLTINCEEIAHTAKSDEASLVPALANQVGYFPVFSWISSLNNMIDLAAVGLIGSKAGFSTPTDAQLKQVLNVTSRALADIKAETIRKKEKEAKKLAKTSNGTPVAAAAEVKEGTVAGVPTPTPSLTALSGPKEGTEEGGEKSSTTVTTGEGKGRSGDELGTDAALLANEQNATTTDTRGYDAPVVILDDFHHKGLQSELLWSVLATWASDLVTSGTAHVVFVTDNPVAMAKTLGRALPNVPFQNITLADADEEKARGYVLSKLKEVGRAAASKASQAPTVGGETAQADEDASKNQSMSSSLSSILPARLTARKEEAVEESTKPSAISEKDVPQSAAGDRLDDETAKWVDLLGGRLTDLESLVQKVSLGYTVETAVKDIIQRTVVEIRKNAFGDDLEDAKALPWTRGQAWLIVNRLAQKGELPYYSLLYDGLKGDEAALKAMEQAELISVRHYEGRPHAIRAGRPVILQALKELCNDDVFADTQRYLSNASSIASSEKEIHEAEQEIKTLGECLQTTGSVAKANQATRERLEHLLNTLASNQSKIKSLLEANAELSKRLAANSNASSKP